MISANKITEFIVINKPHKVNSNLFIGNFSTSYVYDDGSHDRRKNASEFYSFVIFKVLKKQRSKLFDRNLKVESDYIIPINVESL